MTGQESAPTTGATGEQPPTTAPQGGSTENGQGAGTPADFRSAFFDAVVSAVRQQERSSADRQVSAALGLGWYLAALAHPGKVTETAAAVRGATMGLGALSEGQMLAYCHDHVAVAFAKLRDVIDKAAALPAEELAKLGDRIRSAEHDARRKAAGAVDAKVLSALSATDFRLGKAYGIGAALMNLTTRPPEQPDLKAHLSDARMAPILAAIDDLSSALPAHAGHGVRESLREWQKSVVDESPVAPDEPATWLQLARQGELWRAVLAGEKSGSDLLEIEDYVDAADRLSKRMRGVAFRLVKQFPAVCILIVALFAGGVLLVALTNSEAAIVAGAGTILASLGLTWRGVGRMLGGLASKLERPLWGAELDIAVTQAITLLAREEGRDTSGERRKVATDLGRVAKPA
jgi:hypothetical protein